MQKRNPQTSFYTEENHHPRPLPTQTKLAIQMGEQQENMEIDSAYPQVYSYPMLVKTIRSKVNSRCAALLMPDSITYLAGKALGDIVLTRNQIRRLYPGLLVSKSSRTALGPTKLSENTIRQERRGIC